MSTSAPPINETQAPATTGVRGGASQPPAMVEGSPMSTSAPPTDVPHRGPASIGPNGPAPNGRWLHARSDCSNSISFDKCSVSSQDASLIAPLGIYVDKIGSGHEDGTEDQVKMHWLSLSADEIKVCIVCLFQISSSLVPILTVETSGCCTGVIKPVFYKPEQTN